MIRQISLNVWKFIILNDSDLLILLFLILIFLRNQFLNYFLPWNHELSSGSDINVRNGKIVMRNKLLNCLLHGFLSGGIMFSIILVVSIRWERRVVNIMRFRFKANLLWIVIIPFWNFIVQLCLQGITLTTESLCVLNRGILRWLV